MSSGTYVHSRGILFRFLHCAFLSHPCDNLNLHSSMLASIVVLCPRVSQAVFLRPLRPNLIRASSFYVYSAGCHLARTSIPAEFYSVSIASLPASSASGLSSSITSESNSDQFSQTLDASTLSLHFHQT